MGLLSLVAGAWDSNARAGRVVGPLRVLHCDQLSIDAGEVRTVTEDGFSQSYNLKTKYIKHVFNAILDGRMALREPTVSPNVNLGVSNDVAPIGGRISPSEP